MPETSSAYDEDFFTWAKQQAEALRASAKAGSNLQLDWKNLAEEIEDLARSQARGLRAYMMRIVQHLMKLEHSPAIDLRHGWRRSILLARLQIKALFEENPSLKRQSRRLVGAARRDGIEVAILDLEEHAEFDPTDYTRLRHSSYSYEEIVGDWFPPDPGEPRGEEP